MAIEWYLKPFDELTNNELYQIIRLRIDIFVVEQDCPYSDLDGKDYQPGAMHFFGVDTIRNDNENIVAYMRILSPGISYPDMPSLGRVVTSASARGTGLGHQMLEKAVAILDSHWPDKTCHISAQSHLQGYYRQQNFIAVGSEYLEDNIPHIGMERKPQ
ncbi:GNAT family N-acetyltransferase [Aliikangiella sp. G2MR2-5]|uniref:GNAT family N-acetyltransferase n=1 Tax=Aliikangiella sp. G2MR2-5 TaxID=2788943 RepID=UPI0018AC48D8|nr:GNAT family N-acetyltransferase [Aliikangiella sp. G2MR2-5]